MSDFVTLRSNVRIIDPRSKLLCTVIIIVGVSLSLEPFQVLLYLIAAIPIGLLYRPPLVAVAKRFLKVLPLPILFSAILLLALPHQATITIHVGTFTRDYKPLAFVILVSYRFSISILHASIYIESEGNFFELIEGMAALHINKSLIAIMLLISRIANHITEDYKIMLLTAKNRGAFYKQSLFHKYMFRAQLFGRLLAYSTSYSESVADTLYIRGFKESFSSTIRDWSSEGITTLIVVIPFTLLFVSIPWLRTLKW